MSTGSFAYDWWARFALPTLRLKSLLKSHRKRRAAIGIEFCEIDILIGQAVEARRAQKRLLRLEQQNRFGKAVVVKAAPKMNARFYRHHIERIDIHQGLQRERLHDLHQIGGEDQHIVLAEPDADPELAVAFDSLEDRSLNAHRRACGF